MAAQSTLPYELRIGVTGHRDAIGTAVDEAVRKVFDRIVSTLADPAVPVELVVVSPLAPGADRIVARVGKDRGARLEVITPFPVDQYRASFTREEERGEFDELLAGAELIPARPSSSVTNRDEDYLRAGEEVVDESEILIAVWDGEPASGTGGTADIVKYAVGLGRVVLWIHSRFPQQVPFRIEGISEDPSGKLLIRKASFPSSAHALSAGYSQQAAYCNDPTIEDTALEESQQQTLEKLVRTAVQGGLAAGEWSDAVAPMVREHVRSDLLANHYQRWHTLAVEWIVGLAAAAVSVAVVQVVFFPEKHQIIAIEVLLMLIVLGTWLTSHFRKWHQKWLRNPYLAEGLRTAIYSALAGVAAETKAPLPFYDRPLDWMTRTATRMSNEAANAIPKLPLGPLQHFVADDWIDSQRTFHAKRARENHTLARRGHALAVAFFILTVAMAAVHFAHVGPKYAQNLSTALALLAPIWAGAIHTLLAQLEVERVAARSKRMALALVHIHARILRARDPEELRVRTERATALMREEAHEWWVLLSFQDVRLQV